MNHLVALRRFGRDLWQSRGLLLSLAKNDFRARYMTNQLGMLWAFVQPSVLIAIFWFVFEVGFKSKPVADFPFILWLITGMVPWLFVAESLQSATQSVLNHSFLVKKIVFRVALLPMIQIISALVIHLFFVAVMLAMYLGYGYRPSLYWLQIPYYLLATLVLVQGLSWLTSAVVVFVRDLGQLVAMVVQFGFWLTPVFWSVAMLPERFQSLVQLNPIYYLVEGYRDSLIHQQWFWQQPGLTLQFWLITGTLFVTGALVFRKLRPHFADVI
ncbi:ABC transporter permease [Oceanisphaera arctica]|uniref:Transport permease protein n=1 Tax=Oceanisphaera arctica TaxID=641510 RepID=A0A2P5TLJ9_9GAMM|nr:ABC transporter permease [Oceanisphaera arctica]PPL16185.1 teichoic acid ABC transporter permease [Oceanisphaera arctica]